MSYTFMNGFFQTPNVGKQTREVQKLELVASEFICTLTKRTISLPLSSGLFPSMLYDPNPAHPMPAPSLPTPHFLSHQVMTSGFELSSQRVLFSGVQSPLKWNFSYSRSSTKIPRHMFDLFTLHFHQSFTLSIT